MEINFPTKYAAPFFTVDLNTFTAIVDLSRFNNSSKIASVDLRRSNFSIALFQLKSADLA